MDERTQSDGELQGVMVKRKEELPGPVLLDLEPISCSLKMARYGDVRERFPDSLSMRLRVCRGVEVRTPDNRNLTDAEWAITFYDNGDGNELTKLHNALGLINYSAERKYEEFDFDDSPEAFYAWVNLDHETFTLLREMARDGRLPVGFRIRAFGLSYGWEPDGSTKEWDVKAFPNAPISEIEVITQLVSPPASEAGELEEADSFWSDPPKESAELGAMRGVVKAVDQVNARLGWVVGLLAAVVVVVLYR